MEEEGDMKGKEEKEVVRRRERARWTWCVGTCPPSSASMVARAARMFSFIFSAQN